MRKGTTVATLFAVFGLMTLAGCGEKSSGEKMDDAMEQMQDDAEDAGDAAKDAAEDMQKDLEGK